ncbi:uncharacterized protein LOC126482295 isoform X1 [Schistocerca serialis cubense]|uniref:uncharacterized protein LOC126482295 isoform X1 n=1 Tax=Schistocerca serialis cubense TaxID=2023355 RepID=UPI00214E9EA0|nr:uncharacterized protein LOC126482295 isoform X1 [Schistocerca serialis cubense]XP_049962259.1 uncharacterized protein LOC126482295 isoform X1 [Schistocerca serialis cubense]XP_049962260.1 uncharacterized protein LOC126482295 isoform X1 [Schistocerca serialis cubense]
MEDTLKSKHHSRRKRKSEKMTVRGSIKEDNTDRSGSCVLNQKCTSSHMRSPVLTESNSPGTEIQNCSQFIEHEPSVIWDSPQASPNSSHEQNSKIIDLITPPQGKCLPTKKPVTSKPTRKLPGAASPSFLTKLLHLSEQYKYSENVHSEEKEEEDSLYDGESVLHSTSPNRDTVNRQETVSCTLLVKDDFGMLLENDDDDDVILQCTQKVEETINELKHKNFELPNASLSPCNIFRKSNMIQPDERAASNKHVANMVKVPSGKKDVSSELSPAPKPRRSRTPGSAKYYKYGQFIGYGSRKSPRTKKNLSESLTHQEIHDDSLESALQTLVDEDYSFLDTSAGSDVNKTTEINKKGSGKKKSVCDSPTERTDVTKVKTRQNDVRNLSNVCRLTSKTLEPKINERPNTKSRLGKPNKNSLDNHCTLLSESGDAFFETAALDDDIVNETELVNVLEIVESQAVTSSPPLRCTPEEIQRKRIEAKQKLAKKKLNSKTKTSLPSVIKPKR